MDTIFHIFHHAQYTRDGTVLGNLLSPIPPKGDPSLLQRFYKDSNVFDIQSDITQYIKSPQTTLPKDQRNAWIDIYVAYWKAIGEILRAESGNHRNDWAIKVYESWKEVMNLVIRGYSGSSGFQSWTLPVLYTAGKYLRVFAIKADEEQAAKVGAGAVKMETDGLGDDVTSGGLEKNERLEDAARVINRVFTLCISDRYVALIDLSIRSTGILIFFFVPEHRWRSLVNGACTTPQIFSSRHTSRYISTVLSFSNQLIWLCSSIRFPSRRTAFAPSKPLQRICRQCPISQRHTW